MLSGTHYAQNYASWPLLLKRLTQLSLIYSFNLGLKSLINKNNEVFD